MSAEPILPWNTQLLVASEGGLGASVAPAAAQAYEFIDINPGPAEVGEVRPKKDRNPGRGMADGYILGRVKPIGWDLSSSVKSRAAVDTVPQESALYAAAGLKQTVNAGVSVVYTTPAAPQADASFSSAGIYRHTGVNTGTTTNRYFSEQLRGCVVKSIQWSGGDRELLAKFSGDCIGKYHLGYASSITLADGVGTTLTFASVEESYRFATGYYLIEAEIIFINTVNYVAGTAAVFRAQLGSTGAAHAAKALMPYFPPGVSYPGSPISETTCTVQLDGQVIRFTGFVLDFTSGIELGPGETGSKNIQTAITKRYSAKVTLKGMAHREDVALFGKATQQKTPLATIITCGTGTGSQVVFSLPFCEVDPPSVPDAVNDMAMWTVNLRTRDSTTGNDMMSITCT